ncbi:flagellar hook protein FlgE [Anaeromicrobium sediminis]|nr:flagellar hook protein FlgE [Anaeromicrobium sediminis]
MSAMYSGVSGMQAHQVKLDVISNNIANINTVGYKAQTVSFEEVYSQTLNGATAPSDSGRGGTNPMQLGHGVTVSSINTINTQGSMQLTGGTTDFAIDGDGYFIVQDPSGAYMFTRAGNFGLDTDGNLVTADGLYVCGWQEYEALPDGTYVFDTTKDPEPINIFSDEYNKNKNNIAPKATENVVLNGNLDASESPKGSGTSDIGTPPETADFTMPFTAYDDLGNDYEVDVNFTKCYVDDSDPDNPVTTWYWEMPSDGSSSSSGYIKFDKDGNIVEEDGFDTKVDVEVTPDSSTGTGSFTMTIDFESVSMYDAESSVNPLNVDGYPSAELNDFYIGADGVIMGVYSNGQQQPLGMMSLATFSNPAGLERVGNNLFMATANSGDFNQAYAPGTQGAGTLSVGFLEMSNVDLSSEFTEMVIAQRGFQANSRIITTADEMIQELINLKR